MGDLTIDGVKGELQVALNGVDIGVVCEIPKNELMNACVATNHPECAVTLVSFTDLFPPAEREKAAAAAAEAARRNAAAIEADALREAIEKLEGEIAQAEQSAKEADKHVKNTLFKSAAEKNEARKVVDEKNAAVDEMQK